MYGIAISLAIFVCISLAERIVHNEKRDVGVLWGGAFWTILFGVLGARLYHVIDYHKVYLEQPELIWQIWKGGLGIIGGIVAGALALFIYLKIKKQDVWYWLNLGAFVLPLGQAVGRWGNVFNNELLPLAWYEMFFDGILFIILLIARQKSYKVVLPLYVIGYILIRVVTQPLRA